MPFLTPLLLISLLCLPAIAGSVAPGQAFGFFASAVVLGLLLAGLRLVPGERDGPARLSRGLFWAVLLLVYILRWVWVLVLDFSGEGFTHNFFAHVTDQAVTIGLREYAGWLLLAAGAVVVAAVLLRAVEGRTERSGRLAALLLAGGLVIGVVAAPGGPEREWLENFGTFRELVNPGALSPVDRDRLQASGLVALDSTGREGLTASIDARPRNLLLIYLESFQLAFTNEGPLPDLTPGMNRLKQEFGYHPQWLSSADATMQGLISTLCGTLVASSQGASGFANRTTILPGLDCLPDVLEAAGYYQVYLGGFDKAFSGKGLFLSDHGYDEVWGWEDWQKLGLQAPRAGWGLPDEQLFEQALQRVRQLRAAPDRQPYNLTLLTLGTHPPGFASPSCAPYAAGLESRLVQAIHCTDQLLAGFVARLREEQLLDDTLLVITGDHDMFRLPELEPFFPGLAEDPRLLHLAILDGEAVAWPDQVNVAADLPPTLLDLLGVEHNARFMWARSAFEERDYYLTRNFRGAQGGVLEYLAPGQFACDSRPLDLRPPLDDCAHRQLLRLSDQYLFSLYGEQAAPAALCDRRSALRVEATPGAPLVIVAAGDSQDGGFQHLGRAMIPSKPGFYLYIKPSRARAAAHYYFPADHVYRQVKLTELLLDLSADDQFVLAYLPGEHPPLIEPLAALLDAYGLAAPNLDQAFAVISNGRPHQGQAFAESSEVALTMELEAHQCALLAAPAQGPPLFDITELAALLLPWLEQYPDL